MANITLGGEPTQTAGAIPQVQSSAPAFALVNQDMQTKSLADYAGQKKILNVFPSVDTPVCATSVRKFNEQAAKLDNVAVLCISKDLPFAQKRFCGAEGLDQVEMLSDFRTEDFGQAYGVEIQNGAFAGLHARAVVVIDERDQIIHAELVPEVANEPNYEAALAAARG